MTTHSAAYKTLVPFNLAEVLTVGQAARRAGVSEVTIRTWCERHHIGRRRAAGSHWLVSQVALAMFLDSDQQALQAYLEGDRESDLVLGYYGRLGISPKSTKPKVPKEAA